MSYEERSYEEEIRELEKDYGGIKQILGEKYEELWIMEEKLKKRFSARTFAKFVKLQKEVEELEKEKNELYNKILKLLKEGHEKFDEKWW